MATGRLLADRPLLLVGHLLHNALHTEAVADVQRLDVRVAWLRLFGDVEDQGVGRRHEGLVQLEQAGSVQFSGLTAASSIANG